MTTTYCLKKTEVTSACERWVALTPQKRSALIRKLGADGAIRMEVFTEKKSKKSLFVDFKQKSIVVIELTDTKDEFGAPDVDMRRWCYRRA